MYMFYLSIQLPMNNMYVEIFSSITDSGDWNSEPVIITLNNCKQMDAENKSRVVY